MKLKSLIVLTLVLPVTAHSAPIVFEDFETKSLGGLHGQTSNGPNPWTSSGANVTSVGPTVGNQAASYAATMTPGQIVHHSRVDLATIGGITWTPGMTLRASVDVYSEFNTPDVFTGLSMWANTHSDEHSLMGVGGGFAFAGARHGTGPSAPILGHVSNPPYNGWQNIALLVKQTAPNTLTTTYELNGNPFTWNGAIYNTHIDTIGLQNLVFDFSLVTMNQGSVTTFIESRHDNYRVEVVPEPATLLGFGAFGSYLLRRRARRSKG